MDLRNAFIIKRGVAAYLYFPATVKRGYIFGLAFYANYVFPLQNGRGVDIRGSARQKNTAVRTDAQGYVGSRAHGCYVSPGVGIAASVFIASVGFDRAVGKQN